MQKWLKQIWETFSAVMGVGVGGFAAIVLMFHVVAWSIQIGLLPKFEEPKTSDSPPVSTIPTPPVPPTPTVPTPGRDSPPVPAAVPAPVTPPDYPNPPGPIKSPSSPIPKGGAQ